MPVTLARAYLFSSRLSGEGLIYFDDIKNYAAEAFQPDTAEAVQDKATCGLCQIATMAQAIPFRLVVAPDKRAIYAPWIFTPFPAKEIGAFAMANAALGDTFIDLQPP